jgi:3-oxoacyl-[acyl-carrier protein] reductase
VSRRILISGTTNGLGRALAEHYLAQGDIVVGCGRSEAALVHERYFHHQVDVSDESAVKKFFADVRKQLGSLNVLINNAGVAAMNAVALMPPASVRRVVDTNFVGAVMLTHGAIRLFRKTSLSRIVNISSVAVPLRLEGEAVYAASKSALETFTRILAKEVGPLGITCNAVGPCVLRTRLTSGVPSEKLDRLIRGQAVRREATTDDVARVIDFFLRPDSDMVTGQVLYLGGYS